MSRILVNSLICVWQRKSLWPLAFIQLFSLPVAIRLVRTVSWQAAEPNILWALLLLLAFSLVTVILWLSVKAYSEQQILKVNLKTFLLSSGRVFLLVVLGIAVDITLKLIGLHWTVFVLFVSLINATIAAAMLGAVLFGLNLYRASALALDFWATKLSFISAAVFVVLFGHGLAYYLTHTFWHKLLEQSRFSVSSTSATIWILLMILAVLAAFFGSLLNAFLVLLFLDAVKSKKDPEAVKSVVAQSAAADYSN